MKTILTPSKFAALFGIVLSLITGVSAAETPQDEPAPAVVVHIEVTITAPTEEDDSSTEKEKADADEGDEKDEAAAPQAE